MPICLMAWGCHTKVSKEKKKREIITIRQIISGEYMYKFVKYNGQMLYNRAAILIVSCIIIFFRTLQGKTLSLVGNILLLS